MKINTSSDHFLIKKSDFKDLFNIMKICLFLLFAFAFQLMATNTNAQDAIIELRSNSVTVSQLISEIEKQTDYLVVYSNREVNTSRTVNLKNRSDKVSEYLNQTFSSTDIGYDFEKNYIVLSKKAQQTASTITNLVQTLQQQGKTVRGTVTDSNGEPVIGATIIVKANPSHGTVTDIDGNFILSNLPENAVLQITYVGMKPQEANTAGRSTINVVLDTDVELLDEVVVVGYGTQRKANLTGSVSNVSLPQMGKRTVAQTSSALQGLVPGLTVTQRSGKPGGDGGTLRLRGMTTIGNNDPLVLIDGVESSLNSIEPESIESISVLKDAASSAIYGNRAANGVILITTKRAEEGKATVSVNSYIAKGIPTNVPEYVNAVDFMKYISIAKRAVGMTPEYTEEYIKEYEEGIARNDPNYPDVDWFKATATNNALMTNNIATISLGTKNLKSLTQAGYMSQNGITENTNYKRYSLRTNNDYSVSDKFSVSSDLSLLYTDALEPTRLSSNESFNGRIPANQAAYLADGRYGPGWNGNNPVALYKDGGTITRQNPSAILNFNLTYRPIESIEVYGQYALNYWEEHRKDWNKRVQLYRNDGTPDPYTQAYSTLTERFDRSRRNLLVGHITYSKSLLESHNFKVMAGYQQETFWTKWSRGYREDFPFPDYPVLDAGGQENQRSAGSASDYALQAVFGRFNYDFLGKYLFEANLRYDGSSRFARGYRWGVFPSFSAGWRVSEENFWSEMKDVIPNLKLRGSWGQLGNQNTLTGYYPSQSTVNLGTNYIFNKAIASGAAITEMANSIISWETTTMTNIGVDFNIFNKFDVSAEYYYRQTDDILLTLDIPLIIGLSAPSQNAGKVENKGWDFSTTYNDRFGDFNFSATLNLSDVKNKVLDLRGINQTGLTVNREGYPIGSLFGYEADGYIVPEDYDSEGKYTGATQIGNFGPGDIKYKDQLTVDTDGDGIPDEVDGEINTSDKVVIGNQIPRYSFGLNLYGEYKGFDINIFFQGVGKVDGYVWGHMIGSFYEGGSMPDIGKVYWTPENRDAQFPRLAFNNSNNQQASTFWKKDASYIRLKNFQVGYTIPKNYTSKIGISNLRFYASVDNVFTISKFWKYFDVESPIISGYGSFYPIMRTPTVGVNITF